MENIAKNGNAGNVASDLESALKKAFITKYKINENLYNAIIDYLSGLDSSKNLIIKYKVDRNKFYNTMKKIKVDYNVNDIEMLHNFNKNLRDNVINAKNQANVYKCNVANNLMQIVGFNVINDYKRILNEN
ncbi:hypothetical protein DCO58_05890 [Helicobacter saguini]|uniref:Uncharacterized protein n=1 Tax=Helicobacter saguini TaxID=1548018 RepID=A0A347VTF0_9HELI|nr:hypothetical protein [Helicobacter saguini]MWV62123.1 hypothetical protein [Helicobacter saguini]MWV67205.1 hypothetical protein [Helicobacter saguini]MWV69557.1 hypothetical protein [Helicobacter saguini]MWV70892.1 hypothetical protein [Helicobacter saguini]TLD91458.1 hypothetical protein LS64_012005 [Helicobacter saguini]